MLVSYLVGEGVNEMLSSALGYAEFEVPIRYPKQFGEWV